MMATTRRSVLLASAFCLLATLPAFSFEPPASDAAAVELNALQPPQDTPEILVFLKPGTDGKAFARGRGLKFKHALKSDANAFVLSADTTELALDHVRNLRGDSDIVAVYPNQRTNFVRMAFVPNDPYFHRDTPSAGWRGQWHLINEYVTGRDARVQGAWNRNITGLGVMIGIVDDCLETTHPDLAPNYSAADSWDFGQNDAVPDPVHSTDRHGISVSGVAAARGGNGIGVTGAAPYASLAGLRLEFDPLLQTTQAFVDATLYHSSGTNTTIKIKNHSYGYNTPYVSTSAEVSAIQTSAAAGTVHCVAAGNNRTAYPAAQDSNTQDLQNTPEVICVAAMNSNGTFSSYSCYGACVAVTSPSNGAYGITTTDRTGTAGYNTGSGDTFPDNNYTSIFGGTSSATPLVAGVMALVKEVQPALDIRFAKHLLARTSTIVDAFDATTTSDGGWRTNAAGFQFNQNYGFGLINADALTQQAPLYSGVTPLTTEATNLVNVNTAIPDNNTAGVTRTFTISSTTPLEEVEVYLKITHKYRGDVEAYLTSPSGYTGRLMRKVADSGDDIDWTFVTNAFWGENPAGTWTLRVADVESSTSGTWNRYRVTMRMGTLIPEACSTPPTISAIDSNTGHNTGTLSGVTITGTSFESGQTSVKLTRTGQSDIVADNIVVGSSTTLTCDLNLTGAEIGDWNVVVTKGICTPAMLENGFTVTTPPPTITQQPVNSAVNYGQNATFSVQATGYGSLAYQWQKDNADITDGGHYSGSTTSILTVSNIDTGDVASYRCIVSNPGGSTPSEPATLTVLMPGDFDGDGDVDMDDFAVLQNCFGTINPAGPCVGTDLSADGLTDYGDRPFFQGCMSGPNIPLNPDCLP